MIFCFLVIILFLIDQLVKKYMEKNYTEGKEKKILKGNIILSLHNNKGLMLGKFANKPLFVKLLNYFALIILLIVFIFAVLFNKVNLIQKLGISSMLGGAFGNVYDRFKKHKVTDFFAFKFKSNIIFNLADFFIFIGCILTLIGEIIKK